MNVAKMAIALSAVLALSACANDGGTTTAATAPATVASSDNPIVGGAPMFANKTIVENAVESADHTTLVAAVKAAGLVDTLNGPGPFTVFAPTNAAFEKLPAGTVDTLLKPENKDQLTAILTYHVVPGKVMSTDLSDDMEATTVQGEAVTIDLDNGVQVEEANVVSADIETSNGVIHVIDAVILPEGNS